MKPRKPLIEERPPESELAALTRKWAIDRIPTRTVRLTSFDPGRNYEPCKGEAVVAVLDRRGRVAMVSREVLRTHGPTRSWILPSGRVGLWESVEHAAVREVQEETGLQAVIERLLSAEWVLTEFRTWRNKRLHFRYLARRTGGRLKPIDTNEIMAARWFEAKALPSEWRKRLAPGSARSRITEPAERKHKAKARASPTAAHS